MALSSELIRWETSLLQAKEHAAREGRALLFDFSAAPECKGCVAMDTVTYPDPRVTEFMEHHFLPVRVQVKENPALVSNYLVSWTPHVVVADEEERVHYRIEGYLPPEDFLAHLSLGIGKYWLNGKRFP